MRYKIHYKNGKSGEMTESQFEKYKTLVSTRMLNSRQLLWKSKVDRIELARESHRSLYAHRIHQTKDMVVADCAECQR